ncbi:MAG: SurA N-terminal domain-containing protein, partial [Armatimonadetes bacterium]|nr:SurA N-terminal domain-containing protein [Armatimonadota bacterium]
MAVKDTRTPTPRKGAEPLRSEIYKDEKPSPFSIEGIRSGAVQSKLFKAFILLSGLVMAGGLVISGLSPSGAPTQGAAPGATNETVATVGTREISDLQLENTLARQQQFNAQFGQPTGVTNYLSSKQQALQGLTDNAATVVAAQNAGISVSDAEVEAEIDRLIGEELKPQQGQSEAAFRRLVEAQYGSLQGAKDKIKGQVTSEAREDIRAKL